MALSSNPTLCVQHFKRQKLKTSEFSDQDTTENLRDLIVPQIHLACWTVLMFFFGFGGDRYAKVLMEQVWIGGTWNLATYGEGHQHQIFQDNRPFASEKVQLFKCCYGQVLCFSRCVQMWVFGSSCSSKSKFSPLCLFHLHDLQFWFVVSERQLSILLNSMGPCWAGSSVTASFPFLLTSLCIWGRGERQYNLII